MIISIIFNKIKHFLLFFVNIFKRALCCFRRRRRNSVDAVPLTHVGVVSNNKGESEENWNWDDRLEFAEPKTVQDHIELYRKRKIEAQKTSEASEEEKLNFFEDMTPKITKQTKVIIGSAEEKKQNAIDRLSLVDAAAIETGELQEWGEGEGWEGETLDWDAQQALREKRRQDRERKLWEQQQKRQEKISKSLGSRLST